MNVEFRTHGSPYDDPPRAVVCSRCGALVGDEKAHADWHNTVNV